MRSPSARPRGMTTVIAGALLAAACGSSSDDAASETTPTTPPTTAAAVPTTAAPALEYTPGQVAEQTIDDRTYLLYVPETYDPAASTALLIASHGLGESPWSMVRRTQALADDHGVVVASPSADNADMRWDYETDREVAFVGAMIDDVSGTLSIDPERVYVLGHSRGGGLSTYLPCGLGERLSAVATNAFFMHHEQAGCEDLGPIDVIAVISAGDPITSKGADYIRDSLGGKGSLPDPWPEEATQWAATNSCDPTFVERDIGNDLLHRQYDCTGARLEVYVHPKGHIWPGDKNSAVEGLDANDVIWSFFEPTTS